MCEPNTLFLIASFGVKEIDKSGVFESHMWLLNDHEESMKYVSLHMSRAEDAYMGGKIIDVRLADNSEIEEHQDLMEENGKRRMRDTNGRNVVVFRHYPKWKALWTNPIETMWEYKRTGYVDWNNVDDS